jgi:hypothetical protein
MLKFPSVSSMNCITFPSLRSIWDSFLFPYLWEFQFEYKNPSFQSIVTIISVYEFIFLLSECCLWVYRFLPSVGSTVQSDFLLIITFFYNSPPMCGTLLTVDSDYDCSELFVFEVTNWQTNIFVGLFFLLQYVLGRNVQWNCAFHKFHKHFFRVVEVDVQRVR